jgi:hypothetical protein
MGEAELEGRQAGGSALSIGRRAWRGQLQMVQKMVLVA